MQPAQICEIFKPLLPLTEAQEAQNKLTLFTQMQKKVLS